MTNSARGAVAGKPVRFVVGHAPRGRYRKPGRFVDGQSGYVKIRVAAAAGSSRYVQEHRYVMEQALSRKLGLHEIVHHRNGDRADNRLENLQLMTRKEHNEHHGFLVGHH